jgi:hypothetical protein
MHRASLRRAAALIAAASIACSGASREDPTPASAVASSVSAPAPAPAPMSAERVRIVLAASFGTDGTCRKKQLSGCDLFVAEYDLASMTLLSAERVTGEAGVAEDFPILDPGGRYVIYQRERVGRGAQHDLMYVSLTSGEEGTLVEHAREAALSHDGSLLAYTAYRPQRTFDIRLHPVTVSADGVPQLGPAETLLGDGSSSEPYFMPGDEAVAYYRKGERAKTGQTRIHSRAGADEDFSQADGCAHGSVSPSGTRMFCQSSGKLQYREKQDSRWGPLQTRSFPSPEDPAFASCDRITFGHPEFCGSDDLVLTTYTCMNNNTLENAQMMLFDWNSGVVAHLTREMAAALGQEGEARSGACVRL